MQNVSGGPEMLSNLEDAELLVYLVDEEIDNGVTVGSSHYYSGPVASPGLDPDRHCRH
jgi:hypothetical protein